MMEKLLRSAKILVVDDEPANVLLLERLLSRDGFENIQSASDGLGALRAVEEFGPDLILLDIHMPHMGGFEVLERLRSSSPPETYLPVLVLTADASAETKHRALSAGAMDFLIKPFDAAEVHLRVRNLLQTRLLQMRLEGMVRYRTRALQEAHVQTLERLARAGEFRDDDTGHHTQRVGEMAARLARALGLPSSDVEVIRRAAPLHDLGKVGVSDSILLKRGSLTAEEWEAMKQHTVSGAEILSSGPSELIRAAEQIALYHHEKWDGSGYPQGLKGEQIPLPARIVAVVDVYDALSHDRPYRAAWPQEKVIEEIERGRGTHFDPALVSAFLDMIRNGK